MTFQDALYISSSPNVTHFYRQWLLTPDGQASGLRPPKREVLVDLYNIDGDVKLAANGMPVLRPQKATIEALVTQFVTKCLQEGARGEPLTYRNLIIDEMGTLWSRAHAEIVPTCVTKSGKINTLEAHGKSAEWSSRLTDLLRQTLAFANVAVVAHAQEPVPAEDRKGGPKCPNQSTMHKLCADADGVLHRVLQDAQIDIDDPTKSTAARRLWRVHASEHWLSKIRGLPDSDFERIAEMPLPEILKLAGFEP
jgi:hypothetical protein